MRLWLALWLGGFAAAARAEAPELRVFNWSDYLPDEVVERFTAETGIAVTVSTYDSNEAMFAKLKLLDGKGYDLAVPSTYFVDKLRAAGLLRPLERVKLPGFVHLDPRHLNQAFDPGNAYSLPYLWGTTGIAVDARKIDPASVDGWADLWHPRFKGALLLPNDMREVFGLALRTLGLSGNTTEPRQIEAAYTELRGLMPNIRLFNSDSPLVLLVTGEIDIGVVWNGNAYHARRENPDIRYIYPKEGCILWMDNWVIPKGAEHPDNAHRLLDFLLRPEIAALVTEKIGYASPNAEAVRRLKPELRDDPTVYPGEAVLRKGEYQTDIGDAVTLYTDYWERLKAGE
ncbi:spermidine/putrescine transport system substrate-binding protein [Methylomagnum ishizawai]|uniref:Putrescine-binding periplasmic protein n=1 Tax=Methylomagnum ishizawai TaxID=1760988 RepID=A0A1Y6CTK2_9GAMM|nr:extracellular solute-binding protein [Methylomagnum ishizawai]SMF93617.1 spermidine/putrescine transport system substrate-binding protein [Methylomagnum ishizawai]